MKFPEATPPDPPYLFLVSLLSSAEQFGAKRGTSEAMCGAKNFQCERITQLLLGSYFLPPQWNHLVRPRPRQWKVLAVPQLILPAKFSFAFFSCPLP